MTTHAALVLLEAASKGAVILTAALVATSLMRRASASARHLVLALALLAAAVVVPLATVLPEWRVPLLAPLAAAQQGARPESMQRSVEPRSTPPAPSPHTMGTGEVVSALTGGATANVPPAAPAAPRPVGSVLLAVWLLGVAAVVAQHALGVALLWRIRRRAIGVSDPRFTRQISELSRVLGITRPVELITSAATAMPLTWGTWRPAVLLPDVAREWPDGQSRMVLHHELAHVARRDCAWQTVATIATALHWFNPAVWIAARRLRAEREQACDDLVLHGGADPYDYAEQLLDAARRYRAPRGLAVAAIAMARPSRLRGRVAAILDQSTPRRVPSRRGRVLSVALVLGLLPPLAAMRPWRALDAELQRVGSAAPDTLPGAVPSLDPFSALGELPARPDSLTWTRRMRFGQELRVYTMKSDIQVERSPDLDVHIITIFGADDGRGPRQHEFDEDERSIEVCPALPAGVKRIPVSGCWPVDWERERAADNAVRTVVQVPDGIMLRVRTHSGAIAADRISWPLVAETVDGNVRIRSGGEVSVHAVGGNVHVELTRTNWIDRQHLKTVSGRITLRLPADGDVEVTMKSSATNPRTNLAIEREWRGPQGRLHTLARLGAGSRQLDAESWTGEIVVVREGGPAPRPAQKMEYTGGGRPYRVSAGGVTGERVALDLPGDFLLRHDASRVRGALDSASRMRLVRFATSRWQAYQDGAVDPGVNLVGDRALWALSVSDGVDLTGAMLERLNDADWRVRAYAAWVLGETGAVHGTAGIVGALEDTHWRVRAAAASALARLPAAGALKPLERLLADPQYQVRTAALEALAALGDAGVLPRVRALLEDEHAMVRGEALSALAALSGRPE